ncbi:MAG: InlB B-repeat-containing protein [Vescimonas sp.]|uniref:InlB B-repeat-containing protein n=1 Tax=Vescimonas sp. TaxID=2892404 RepID=UPI002A91C61A|nr:InlB B-repeat-containing protein [Vescimonas sp.]MDY5333586.1 InlB B-repeat-containing protein [Vescimonas sp.]
MKRRIVSVLTALVMALSLLPVQALAEDAAVGEPVTEIEQAEKTGEGEEPGDPEEEQEPGEPEEPVREFVQGEAQLTVSTAAMAAGTAAAEVGTAADLTAALADSANGVVRLTADITITAGLKIQHNVTVNLNGHVLRYDEAADPDSIFRVAGGKTLTLTDSRPAATHEDAKLPAGGLITGGSFYKPVCTEGHVSGGTFYDGLTLEKNAKPSGKPMNTGTEINGKTIIPNPNGKPVTVIYKDGSGEYAKQIVQAGETAIEPDVPSRQGYQFTGWYLDDTKYDFNTAVTGDMTLTAKWTVCDHKESTAQPTCTTPAICTACGGTLAALGHKWGPWTSGGNNTHTRTCKRDGSHTETKDCSGGTATCTEKAKCSVCGAEYGDLNPAHHANLVNVPAKAATTSAEGNIEYWHCGGCGKYYKDAAAQDEITQEDTVIAKRRVYYAPSLYPVRNGTNPPSGTEYSGGVYGLIFRAAVSGITGVQVDGRTVGRGSYTVEGSYPVELYLKASYLNRLAKGSHTLTVLTDSGSLTAAFTVGSGKSSPTTFDAGIAVYAAAAVTSLTGLELLRRRRKEEE